MEQSDIDQTNTLVERITEFLTTRWQTVTAGSTVTMEEEAKVTTILNEMAAFASELRHLILSKGVTSTNAVALATRLQQEHESIVSIHSELSPVLAYVASHIASVARNTRLII